MFALFSCVFVLVFGEISANLPKHFGAVKGDGGGRISKTFRIFLVIREWNILKQGAQVRTLRLKQEIYGRFKPPTSLNPIVEKLLNSR